MKSCHFTFPLFLLVPWLLAHTLVGSPVRILTGQITNEKGDPVPYAELYLPELEWGTTTDRDGRFRLSYDPQKGTRLDVRHSAYKPVTIDLNTLTTPRLDVSLSPRTYHFDPVTVEGNLYGKGSLALPVPHRVFPFNRQPGWGNSVGERLDRRGIQIKDYGGPAGLKTVASPTGYGEHILVMLDGLPLNSPQHGGFDFSSLPAELLKQGEYYDGHGSSLYGSNAVGGTLNLLPYDHGPLLFRLKSGSFGEKGIAGWLPIALGNANVSLYGNSYENTGDFRFSRPGRNGIRSNNDFGQTAFALAVSRSFSQLWKVTYFGLGTKTSRGVAGSLQFPSPSARKTNNDRMHLLSLRGISGLGQSEIYLGLVDTYEHYTNPDWQVDSEHIVSSWILRVVQRFPEKRAFRNSMIVEARRQGVDSDDAGNHRTTLGAVGGLSQLHVTSNLELSLTVRSEIGGDGKSPVTTGGLGLRWKPHFQDLKSIMVNAGTSYRNPTFNDRYWEDPSGFSRGNPDLSSERGRSIHVGMDGVVPSLPWITMEGVAYHFLTRNLIQWTPDENFVFSPENLASTESFGMTFTTGIDPPTIPLRLTSTTNLNHSRLLSSGPDQYDELLYVPRFSQWVELEYTAGTVEIIATYRYMGRRRYRYADNPETAPPFLDPYRRLDVSVALAGPRVHKIATRFVIGARNLENRQDQESVFGYPEPGRALFARLVLQGQ
ncbi:MAG: carboxypeptidase-like regulatory domain-containing protein [Fidelibacterota bacterium]